MTDTTPKDDRCVGCRSKFVYKEENNCWECDCTVYAGSDHPSCRAKPKKESSMQETVVLLKAIATTMEDVKEVAYSLVHRMDELERLIRSKL